ncbi:hypothetical protein KIPB_005407, partial [Kipferlia bialata]
ALITPAMKGAAPGSLSRRVYDEMSWLAERSNWIMGGDGWAYDIDFGGLDHVLANGDNVNVFVIDNNVYANTGGQFAKSTPQGAVAKNCTGGKARTAKRLGLMMMTYGNIYVATVSMGANKNQCLKAIREAESYDGPSLLIGYSPCIAHMVKGGLTNMLGQQKLAVETGFWPLYRFDPRKGEKAFQLDSRDPKKDIKEFLSTEGRFQQVRRTDPAAADEMEAGLRTDLAQHLEFLKKFQA